jgi:phospholipase C
LIAGSLISVIAVALSLSPTAHAAPPVKSKIQHLIVVIQENHSFDSYFGRYCTGPADVKCTAGAACCEKAPESELGVKAVPSDLTDENNFCVDICHVQSCEVPHLSYPAQTGMSFRYAKASAASYYWNLASGSALADRYFQPVAGASSSNDVYFARAGYGFKDNNIAPLKTKSIADLLAGSGWKWSIYLEGYADWAAAKKQGGAPIPGPGCPPPYPELCAKGPGNKPLMPHAYPCVYDPGDNPFAFFHDPPSAFHNDPNFKDFTVLADDINNGALPAVSWVRSYGYRSEHPGASTISAGTKFIDWILTRLQTSPYFSNTLVLITWDESGGFYDHVDLPPSNTEINPQTNKPEAIPYGPRVPLIAWGKFAKTNYISHVRMDHSSIVKFIEWNWLDGKTGQLSTRDVWVNNIGSMLDPAVTGASVP